MDLEAACDLYLTHLRVERNLSPHTVESYANDLRSLRTFLAQTAVRQVDQVGLEGLTAWIQSLSGARRQASSIRRARSAVRQLFLFLLRERHITANPAANLEGPRPTRPLPHVLEVDLAQRLMEAPTGDEPRVLRDRAMLELLYGSGLRASELCELRLEDVGLNEGLLRPRGKGNKERLVPLGSQAAAALQAYLAAGRPPLLKGRGSPFVFIGNRGQALSRMGLYKIVRRYGAATGVATPLSPHGLRHAFATHLLRGGADLRAVQQMLGHVSISTTEIYTHVARDELKDTVDTHHPLGRGRR